MVLARYLFAGQPLQEAISRGRSHAETNATVIVESDRWNAATVDALRTRFENIEEEVLRGPLTEIRRDADRRISFALDDRTEKGFAAISQFWALMSASGQLRSMGACDLTGNLAPLADINMN